MRRRTRLVRVAAVLLAALGAALALAYYLFRYLPIADLPQVEAPAGTQLLLFPIDNGLIVAGYANPDYASKKGYPHYGIDITTFLGGQGDILAAGDGVVLGTEHCDNSLGYIAVIRHDNVYLPQTGEVLSLVGRYYHMTELQISEGDPVRAGETIGTIDRSHKWHNHVHLELDTDLAYPFHTPQVAEASSELLHRYPASGETLLEPLSVLVLGRGQRISPLSAYGLCEEKDRPLAAAKR